MLDVGFSAAETASALGIDPATVYRYSTLFTQADSIDTYLQLRYCGSSPRLNDEQQAILREELTTTLHRSAASVATFIGQRFALCYAERGVRHLLYRVGFRFKKTRLVPVKADPQVQRHFLRYCLLPLLARARKRGEPVYFCDAATDWGVPSTSGHRCLKLYGVINSQNLSDLVVLSFERIDAASVIAVFQCLEQEHPSGRIAVVCDNASYYHSKEVRRWVQRSRIRLLFLPAYSPNLNLIEQLWRDDFYRR